MRLRATYPTERIGSDTIHIMMYTTSTMKKYSRSYELVHIHP